MIRNIIVAVVAFAILAGVGLYFYGSLNNSSRRLAMNTMDACYMSKGYDPVSGANAPQAVIDECSASQRQWADDGSKRMLIAGGVGSIPALIFLGAAFLYFRRRKPELPAGT